MLQQQRQPSGEQRKLVRKNLPKKQKFLQVYCILKEHQKNMNSVKWFSCSLCLTLQSHGLRCARIPCPSPSPRACSNSCPSSWWCHPIISSLLLPSVFPSIKVFSNESVLCIRWPKYWSFSFSIGPFNEYSGLISFRIDWFDLFAVQETLNSLF